MTPGARLAAAIEVTDDILSGNRAEKALTAWGRRSRFAGSKDRRAVRDHVYDMLRRRRSYAALGGANTGRGIAIGSLRAAGISPDTLMTGIGHAPASPSSEEVGTDPTPPEAADLADWLFDAFVSDWGDDAHSIAVAQRNRAPVFLRVNLARADRDKAINILAGDDIAAEPVQNIKTALRVTDNERKIVTSEAYLGGLVELQDASSQAAVLTLPLTPGDTVLDYCAGGGGKSLAMAGLAPVTITAHDAYPQRMRDLPVRASRAGCSITIKADADLPLADFDLVLADSPCSGSGTWRRDPEGKWRLTPSDLADLNIQQQTVLTQARRYVRPGGHLAYATCSVLRSENDAAIDLFLRENPDFEWINRMQTLPGADGDGFFLCVMKLSKCAT